MLNAALALFRLISTKQPLHLPCTRAIILTFYYFNAGNIVHIALYLNEKPYVNIYFSFLIIHLIL
jgi:hypothetical protein